MSLEGAIATLNARIEELIEVMERAKPDEVLTGTIEKEPEEKLAISEKKAIKKKAATKAEAPATVSYEDVKASILRLAALQVPEGGKAAKEILSNFNVSNGKELDESQYPEVVEALQAKIEEMADE